MENLSSGFQDCGNNQSWQNNSSIEKQLKNYNASLKVAIPVVIGFLLLFGSLGNFLVIWITFTSERVIKHRLHSMLVVNLAVADLIYLIASGPYQAVVNSVPGWIFGAILCRFLHFCNVQTMGVSIFTMCSLAVIRFIGLALPFRFQSSCLTTSRRLAGLMIIVAIWIISSVLALPNLSYFDYFVSNVESCEWKNLNADAHYSFVLLVTTYVIPLLLVTVLYIIISRKIFREVLSHEFDERSESVRTTMMVFSLILAFLICWFPHHLFRMILASQSFCAKKYVMMRTIVEAVGYCFSYAHACTNPIIYTFAAPSFRRNIQCFGREMRQLSSPKTVRGLTTRGVINEQEAVNAICSNMT